MSVSYTTRFGYGFQVSQKEVKQMTEEKLQAFQESDYALSLNGWEPDTCNYFFGILQGFVDPGYMVEVPTRRNYNHEEFMEMLEEFKSYFPDRKEYVPRDYILACID